MPDRVLDHAAQHDYLPHRGVNLIADTITLDEGGVKATSLTRIAEGDPRGRSILARAGADGRPVWNEPFLGELMALTGVVLLDARLKALGQVAVFSMISRVTCDSEALHGEDLHGEASIIRDRGSFSVFATRAISQGRTVLEAEVMSGSATFADISTKPVRPFPAGVPGEPVDPALFTWKPATLRFVDTVVAADSAAGTLTCAYRYPEDHPFVSGHFPAAPLMMGVTQWAAAADATFLAARRFGLGPKVVAQGTISRPDGSEVLDIRDLVLDVAGQAPRLLATKRLAFREPVRPGDGLLISVTVTAAAS